MLVRAKVNGEWREADVWEGASLLAMLRDDLGLPGSKNACEQGECGSCSVWLDGELVCSCLVLAAQAHDREAVPVGALQERRPVDQQRARGVDRQHARAGFVHRVERAASDHRHVEAHVLLRLGDLDDAHAAAGELPGAGDDGVGPFHRLDGNDRRRLDRDCLADVESGNRIGHPVAECQIGLLVGRRRPSREHTLAGEERREKGGRIERLPAS